MTWPSTPKSMEDLVVKIMQTQKAAELFQTMGIINLNMGNLNLEVNNMKNILATWEKGKAIQHEELDKEKDF